MNFPTTQWSLFALASMNGDESGREAMNTLCRTYRAPVLAYFRSHLSSREDAEDLTQAFFSQLVERRIWQQADAERGRFRNFLLSIATAALRNWIRVSRSARKGGGTLPVSLDLLENEELAAAPDDGAGLAFDRDWACAAVSAAYGRLEKKASGNQASAARFLLLKQFLPGGPTAPQSYELVAAELGISLNHIKTLIYRLRSDFRDNLRDEVRQTLTQEEDLDAEMAHLRAIMAAGHHPPETAAEIS